MYFIYGKHWCTNIVTEERGMGAAVLLRAGIVSNRGNTVQEAENRAAPLYTRVNGPGRLSRVLDFDGRYTGTSVLKGSAIVVVEDAESDSFREHLTVTPRIGISVATNLLLRFVCAGAPHGKNATGTQHLQTTSL